MNRVTKTIGAALAIMLLLCSLVLLIALKRWDRTFVAPMPNLRSVSDTGIIARGRYLAYGPAHCADCHAPPEFKSKVDSDQEVPMSGGYEIKTYLGEIRPPNITPDSVTGMGRITDGELARFFRYGVDHRGQVGLPIMMLADLSDKDLVAIISFLRSTTPVKHEVAASHYNLLGKMTRAFFLEPFAPKIIPPPSQTPAISIQYGDYLVNTVSNCASCHTERNMKTGDYTGPRLAGGMVFRSSGSQHESLISPNLTPDSATGRITKWSQEIFIQRFKMGNLGNTENIRSWSPMPWGPFSRMTDQDLGAIYLYLMQLPPVHKENVLPKENPL